MSRNSISAALIDVGGTLWPERPPLLMGESEGRTERLCAAIPTLTHTLGRDLCNQLLMRTSEFDSSLAQDIHAMIREIAQRLGLPIDEERISAIRRAMSLPVVGLLQPFAGAQEFLETVKELDLSCIIVTNAAFRDSRDYRRDFEDLRLAAYIDGIISSVDVGFRKPHLAMFEAAIAPAGCTARECVFIGNSERNDVEPAVSLGMRVIRVAIEEPRPVASAAHLVVTSLADAAAALQTWVRSAGS